MFIGVVVVSMLVVTIEYGWYYAGFVFYIFVGRLLLFWDDV